MKVLLLNDPRQPGYATLSGVHKYFYELVAAAPAGVEYLFVNGDNHEGTKARGKILRDNHEGTKARRGLGRFLPLSMRLLFGYCRDVLRMARVLRSYRDKVDLLHVVAGGCEVAPIAAKLAGFPAVVDTVQAMHGEDAGADHWVRRLVERLCFRCSNYHIFVSDATRVSWEKRLRRTFPKSCTIYNAMQPPDFSQFDSMAYRRQFMTDPENCFVIGICARLHHMKGHRVLIEAFAALIQNEFKINHKEHKEHKEKTLYLLIAGEGPERESIEAQVAGLPWEIAERIQLVGHREDPCFFVACLDLHVMASTSIETIGYANIEAMFAGVPCIVSDVGGAKEIVRASGGGMVVPGGDVDALTVAMLEYAINQARCERQGRAGKDYSNEHLTASVMAQKTLVVYGKVAG